MASSTTKKTPKNLKVGDLILITRRSDGLLKVAGVKRNSIIAEIRTAPKRVPHPDGGGKRGGYALNTSSGIVPFVTGVSAVMLATAEDRARMRREEASRPAAIADSASVLSGVTASEPAADSVSATVEDHRPAAAQQSASGPGNRPSPVVPAVSAKQADRPAGEWMQPTRSMREAVAAGDAQAATAAAALTAHTASKRPTPKDVPARPVRKSAGVGARGDSDQHRPAVGENAARNYTAMASAAKTDRARAFWTRLAEQALAG